MTENQVIFSRKGKQLTAYSTYQGMQEVKSTAELLAYNHKVPLEEIRVTLNCDGQNCEFSFKEER